MSDRIGGKPKHQQVEPVSGNAPSTHELANATTNVALANPAFVIEKLQGRSVRRALNALKGRFIRECFQPSRAASSSTSFVSNDLLLRFCSSIMDETSILQLTEGFAVRFHPSPRFCSSVGFCQEVSEETRRGMGRLFNVFP